jgi:hypothetical protein
MSDNTSSNAKSVLYTDEFAGQPGSFIFDPSTGKRVRNAPVVAAAAEPVAAPVADPDQPAAAVVAEPETQGHDQENT